MWFKTFVFAVILYILSIGYSWLYVGHFTLAGVSESLALTACILIGTSFALSGLTFFYNFLDSKLKYRKHLGLMGFYIATIYSVSLAFRFSDRYIFNLMENISSPEILLGLGAMFIFGFMFIISFGTVAKHLGSRWRPLLRTGYLAYLLLIIRAIILESASWQLWIQDIDRVPPPRLIATVFAIWVIVLRLVLEVAIAFHKQPKPRSKSVVPSTAVTTDTVQTATVENSIGTVTPMRTVHSKPKN